MQGYGIRRTWFLEEGHVVFSLMILMMVTVLFFFRTLSYKENPCFGRFGKPTTPHDDPNRFLPPNERPLHLEGSMS